MKKWLFIHLVALFAAVSILSGSVVFASTKINTMTAMSSVSENEGFLQEDEPGIAEIFTSSKLSDSSSSQVSLSSENVSSTVSGHTSSHPSTSMVLSFVKKPVSSNKPVASSKPVSSGPVSNPESSQSSSRETLSSEEEVSSSDESERSVDSDYQDILDTLAGAVQREIIGAGVTPLPKYYEAYKAQAVACHSYMEYHRLRNGSYPQMSYTSPDSKTVELVREVLDELIYYDGKVINAAYHAASGGHTQSASSVWGGNVPYMTAVESAYDEYERTFTISDKEAADKLSAAGIDISGTPDTWFDLQNASMTDGNFVDVIDICGTPVKCRTLRESVFGANHLMSTKIIDISYDGDNFVFTTLGYGHGAGLSQLGALGYAANAGLDYRAILKHYYSGVTVQ